MPDAAGRLTDDEQQSILNYLNERAPSLRCSACGARSFQLVEHVVEYRPFSGGSLRLGGVVYPIVMLTCTNCGHFLTFSALKVGVKLNESTESEEAKRA